MTSKSFQAPAILTSIALTKDGGLRIGFATNELGDEEKLAAAKYHNKFGWLLFRENEFTDADVPDYDAASDEDKTPSQRLRGVIYRLWQQHGSKGDFEGYYRKVIDKAIERVKAQLDD